ncbi:hypothetical protein EW145_g7006 [Phellinidium pouzarii]|uniref:Uncharacterized protein n=1 Tax=Phellinidium pouzarii TaxID=167371 RepID=A0A4S4KSI7_9AGAM|nr:hypothetical protein EW145_g7006 [Phellinidium pouzarii]
MSSYARKRKRRIARGPSQSEASPPQLRWLAPTQTSVRDRAFENGQDVENDAWDWSANGNAPQQPQAQMLCVEAHEADLVLGQETAALMLEVPSRGTDASALTKGVRGKGLIRLGAENSYGTADEDEGVWVDRYDARLLLGSLPPYASQAISESVETSPPSPSGWSDLPSDAEDEFFLTPSEVVEFRHAKRRRLLDDAHTAHDDAWGGSDEEPPAETHALMVRTAIHLAAAQDAAQLGARILANHGGDARFAFLRGRWRRAWVLVRAEAREDQKKKGGGEQMERSTGNLGLAGLNNYGDSDSEGGDENENKTMQKDEDGKKVGAVPQISGEGPSSAMDANEAARIEARRARAREWAARRRTEKGEKSEKSADQSP